MTAREKFLLWVVSSEVRVLTDSSLGWRVARWTEVESLVVEEEGEGREGGREGKKIFNSLPTNDVHVASWTLYTV